MKKTVVVIVALFFVLGMVGMSIAATAKKVGDDQVPADMKAQKDQTTKQKPGQLKDKPGQLKDKPGLQKEKAPGQLKDKSGLQKEKAPGQTKIKDTKAGQYKEKAPAADQKANTVR